MTPGKALTPHLGCGAEAPSPLRRMPIGVAGVLTRRESRLRRQEAANRPLAPCRCELIAPRADTMRDIVELGRGDDY